MENKKTYTDYLQNLVYEGLERWSPNAKSIQEDYIRPMKKKNSRIYKKNFEENIEEYIEKSPKTKEEGFSFKGFSHRTNINININIFVNIKSFQTLTY